uniref:Fungal lipase-type domain-containing protein n=1 Tax=Auxenochlorella protothecoides TaxID=3075 RepID=A0A1D2A3M3_AUXPR
MARLSGLALLPSGGMGAMRRSTSTPSIPLLAPRTVVSPTRRLGVILRAVSQSSVAFAKRLFAATGLPPSQASGLSLPPDLLQAACRHLQVESVLELQDLLSCAVLSEVVYKVVDMKPAEVLECIQDLTATLPPGLCKLRAVQWALPHVQHRFMLAESDSAMYLAFMGTKMASDFMTNVNLWQEEMQLDPAAWAPAKPLSQGAERGEASPAQEGGGPAPPLVHRGFLNRARSVPVEAIYAEAEARGKRLVLCGHSLGGAVAALCTVSLLARLPRAAHAGVSCYGFATPAVANGVLADICREAGWDKCIRNYLMPEDPIPRLLSWRAGSGAGRPEGASTAGEPPPPSEGLANNIAVGAERFSSLPGLGPLSARPGRVAEEASGAGARSRTGGPAAPPDSAEEAASSSAARGQQLKDRFSAAATPPIRVVARTAGAAARYLAAPLGAAASAPLRAAPNFTPLGRQLYVTPGRVIVRGAAADAALRAQAELMAGLGVGADAGDVDARSELGRAPEGPGRLAAARRRAAAAASVAASTGSSALALAGRVGGTLSSRLRRRPPSSDEEDNADVAAAVAAAQARAAPGAVESAPQQPAPAARRALFPAHRMHAHRRRLLDICRGVFGEAAHARAGMQAPPAVVLSSDLAPQCLPRHAEARLVVAPAPAATAARPAGAAAAQPPPQPPQRWLALRALLRRVPGEGAAPAPRLQLLVRASGLGLGHVVRAAVVGLPRDPGAPGVEAASTPAPAAADALPLAILSKPAAIGTGGEDGELVAAITLQSTADIAALLAAARACVAGTGPVLALNLQSDLVETTVELTLVTGDEPSPAVFPSRKGGADAGRPRVVPPRSSL